MGQSTDGARIIERSWRLNREITAERYMWDIDYAKRMGELVRSWSGLDRDGQPLRVVWVAGRLTGQEFSAYEIGPCPHGNAICSPEALCPECKNDKLIRQRGAAFERHVATCNGNRLICALYDHL